MKCKNINCRKEILNPRNSLQQVCNFQCALEYAAQQRIKKEAKQAQLVRLEYRQAKERLKSRKDWLKEAQIAFNAFIRYRDKDLPCISCQSLNRASWDAGHYRTTAAAPELRFNELNVHRQCVQCNQHQHGNLLEFRIGLIKRIGQEKVDWLEGKHNAKHYSIDILKLVKLSYKDKLKQLKY
jgi:hypothetical protein